MSGATGVCQADARAAPEDRTLIAMHAPVQLSSVADFLSRNPPFAGLGAAELERIAAAAAARA